MVTRRELYGLVWSKPMTKVAEELGVSGSYMVRVCLTLNVPCPARGYWAKLAAGKAPPPEPIPEARPGDPPEWSKDTQLPSHRFRNPTILKRRILPPSAGLGGQHALLRGTREHYLKSRYDKETEYLKAAKKNLPDITASKAGLDTAMEFANALYTALETEGYRTILAPNHEPPSRDHIDKHEVQQARRQEYEYPTRWSPYRITVVYVGDLAIGLAIIEMTERVELRYLKGKYIREEEFMLGRTRSSINDGWTSTKDLPSGRLRLVAYSPYRNAKLAKQWQETKAVKLNARIGAIVRLIKSMAPEMEALRGEARRQEEFRRKEYEFAEDKRRRAEDKRQIEQSIKDSRDHLNKVNIQWSETQGIVRFLQGVEEAANNLPNAEREVVLSRLQLAEEFLGAQDPLQHFLKW